MKAVIVIASYYLVNNRRRSFVFLNKYSYRQHEWVAWFNFNQYRSIAYFITMHHLSRITHYYMFNFYFTMKCYLGSCNAHGSKKLHHLSPVPMYNFGMPRSYSTAFSLTMVVLQYWVCEWDTYITVWTFPCTFTCDRSITYAETLHVINVSSF